MRFLRRPPPRPLLPLQRLRLDRLLHLHLHQYRLLRRHPLLRLRLRQWALGR